MGNCINLDIALKRTRVLPILYADRSTLSVISTVQIKDMPGDKLLSQLKIRYYFEAVKSFKPNQLTLNNLSEKITNMLKAINPYNISKN